MPLPQTVTSKADVMMVHAQLLMDRDSVPVELIAAAADFIRKDRTAITSAKPPKAKQAVMSLSELVIPD